MLTGVQDPPGRERPRKTLSRGAQHCEPLRWLIVYNERIRQLINDDPTREIVVRDGDGPAKMYSVTFGGEKPVSSTLVMTTNHKH